MDDRIHAVANRDISVDIEDIGGKFDGQLSLFVSKVMGEVSLNIYAFNPKDLRLKGIWTSIDREGIKKLRTLLDEAEEVIEELS